MASCGAPAEERVVHRHIPHYVLDAKATHRMGSPLMVAMDRPEGLPHLLGHRLAAGAVPAQELPQKLPAGLELPKKLPVGPEPVKRTSLALSDVSSNDSRELPKKLPVSTEPVKRTSLALSDVSTITTIDSRAPTRLVSLESNYSTEAEDDSPWFVRPMLQLPDVDSYSPVRLWSATPGGTRPDTPAPASAGAAAGSAGPLSSVGAAGHDAGTCRPCAHNWRTAGCSKGEGCSYCHSCTEKEWRAYKRMYKNLREKRDKAEQEEQDDKTTASKSRRYRVHRKTG